MESLNLLHLLFFAETGSPVFSPADNIRPDSFSICTKKEYTVEIELSSRKTMVWIVTLFKTISSPYH